MRDGPFEIIILQDHRARAISVPGSNRHSPQIILTSGIIAALSASELELVCAHEESHIRLRHHRKLILAAAAERSMWFWPYAARSAQTLRLALERAADEEAAGREPQSRARLRSALLAVAVDEDAAVLAAFSPLDCLIERVTAMEQPPPRALSPIWWCALFLPGMVIGAVALFAATRLGHSAYCLLTMPGSCRLR